MRALVLLPPLYMVAVEVYPMVILDVWETLEEKLQGCVRDVLLHEEWNVGMVEMMVLMRAVMMSW